MIPVTLLKRFWPYLAGAALIVGFYLWAYDRGADAVQAKWDVADRIAADALLVANTKTALETDRAEVITADIGRAFDEDLRAIDRPEFGDLRLCDEDGSRSEPVPAVSTSATVASGQRPSDGGDRSPGRLGSLLEEALQACRKVIAADQRHIEFHERQAENRR